MKADPVDESWYTEQLSSRRAVLVIHGAIRDLDAVTETDVADPIDVAPALPRQRRDRARSGTPSTIRQPPPVRCTTPRPTSAA